MSSKKSFFSIPPASGSHGKQGSQGNTPRRNASSNSLSRGSGSVHKPGWQGVYEGESAPSSRRGSYSEDSGELGAKTPPLTPPLMKLTRVKVEGERHVRISCMHAVHIAVETGASDTRQVSDSDSTYRS